MSFIVPGAEPTTEEILENLPFFPDIDPVKVRDEMRLDGTITEARLHQALINAMQWANKILFGWQLDQQDAGYNHLSEVPNLRGSVDSIGGQNQKVSLYTRAVACYAAAECVDRYKNFDSSGQGQKRADDQQTTIDDLRRDAYRALQDLQGKRRVEVELI